MASVAWAWCGVAAVPVPRMLMVFPRCHSPGPTIFAVFSMGHSPGPMIPSLKLSGKEGKRERERVNPRCRETLRTLLRPKPHRLLSPGGRLWSSPWPERSETLRASSCRATSEGQICPDFAEAGRHGGASSLRGFPLRSHYDLY